jgi:hypothetical protein
LFRNPEEGQGSQMAVMPAMTMMIIQNNKLGCDESILKHKSK